MVMEDIWSGDIWIDPQRTKHLYHPCESSQMWSFGALEGIQLP